MVGIIGAMGVEVRALKEMMQESVSQSISGIEFTSGKINGTDVVVAACGIGKVFAGLCAEVMILKYKPDYVINTGVGGTLSRHLSIGNIAIASGVVQHDMDTTALGDPAGLISGINVVRFECDKHLVSLIENAADVAGFARYTGTVATGDCFIADQDKKNLIAKTFDAIACEMEGGAIGQVCYVNNVPFAVIRAISDDADGNSHENYPAFLQEAASNSIEVLCRVLKELSACESKSVADFVRTIPDFPEKGIMFRDVTSVLQSEEGLTLAIDKLQGLLEGVDFDVLAGAESRGFLFGMPLAYNLGKSFALVRKKGKLPRETISEEYELEYGTAEIEMHTDSVMPGQKVVLIDDLLATGGTAAAAVRLIERLGGEVVKIIFLIELEGLEGRKKLAGYDVGSVVKYEGK